MKSDDILNIATKRGFFFPSGEIYGAKAGFWTYGHLGTMMKHKFENLWKNYFLKLNDNYFEIEDVNILSEEVFKSSGHLKHFTDPLKDEKGNVKQFNMMIGVKVGVTGDEMMYLRPETAQSPYISFKREFMALREKLPLGLAIIGKAFRNEINPRQGFYRLREFTQAELQIFFEEGNFVVDFNKIKNYKLRILNKEIKCSELKLPKFYIYHLAKIQQFYLDVLKMPKDKFRFRGLDEKERAFYNKIHYDIELDIESFGGWKEMGGLHYRGDYDLKNHKVSVNYNGKNIYPHVLELSFGVDRNIWGLMDVFYRKEKERELLMIPYKLSPINITILPLVNKGDLEEIAKKIFNDLKSDFDCFYDNSGSIGRRYARNDEIGTSFCITIDYDSLKKKDVTIRIRDTTKQIRVKIKNIKIIIKEVIFNNKDILKFGKVINTRIKPV